MNILAICSALNNSYLALKYEDKVISEIIRSDENYHSLYLISKINDLFNKQSYSFDKLDAIAVNCGPGSFTGIRAALSITKVMASELSKPLIPLNTAEILLNAYDKEVLLMDARRDMFFYCTKNNIELILKDKIIGKIKEAELLTDLNSYNIYNNSTCFEKEEKDLGLVMLKLAENKFLNITDKKEFNFENIKANYIQTPPIF